MKTSIINIVRSFRWLKGSIRTCLLFVILCVLVLCQFGCAYAQLQGATINNIPISRGESLGIEVIREGEQITPELGLALEKGDEIKTPTGVTALIRFGSGSEVIMMPETHITIESISLWFGKVIARIKGKFKVKTEYVNAGVRSTLFLMSVDNSTQTTVTMIEGSVLLTSNKNFWPSVPLQSGHEAIISSSQRPEVETMSLARYNEVLRSINITRGSILGNNAVFVAKIIGLQQNEAQNILSSYGHRIGKVTKTIEGDYAIGEVVRQRPESGKELKRGRSVDIWVRVRAVIVPNVVGQHLEEAMNIIRREGLSVGDIRRTITGKYEPGVVNAQSPNAGERVVEGSAVELTVEEESVVIPDVRGKPVEQAESEIRQQGLNVRRTNAGLDPNIRVPQVVGQDPAPGNRVKPGKTVTLRVAEPGVRVPNVIGRNERDAANLLSQRNLRMGRITRQYNNRYQANVVINQSPGAERVVKPGSTVALTVSRGQDPSIPVPNLLGLSQDAARKVLAGKNLRAGQVKYEYREGSRIGVVISQSPPAGQRVMPGTVVSLTISARLVR